ncbi:NAD(P)-dependent oxidoreductase [Mycobacterium sp. E796]|uniref:NAD(P)-dependent oxidoreductase n=1 Tax=Mycobacterium sp. E796 TaxID=1834151 RepID=UPI000A8A217C|nr:NAD(P)H-binding protein [Mycobacterium sp. E796]
MQIVIFGANGSTGRLVTRRVLDAGHAAVAVTRRPDEFPIFDARLAVAGADVRRDHLAGIVAGADVVLSTLGVPFARRPVDTYSVGTRNIVNAMRESGVGRLVVVSSTGAYPARGRRHTPLALRCSSRSSPAPSARPSMTTSAGWKRWCARVAWTGRSCARRDCSICLG